MTSAPRLLHDLRNTVERLALPNASLVEWASRRGLSSDEIARTSGERLTRALDSGEQALSPVLELRLRALVDELSALGGEDIPATPSPEPFRQAGWTLLRHLAESALREPGWP
jgi:hypothetical protein